jgi:hypothetical protein
MEIISKLKPTTFEYASDISGNFILPKGNRYGLIAQEVELVLPNLVKSSKHRIVGKDTDDLNQNKSIDFKAVNYTELIPILVAAVQEQNTMIEFLKKEVQDLKNH